jgi:hypothetical protein
MVGGVLIVLVGSGIYTLGGAVAHVLGTMLVVVGLFTIPYLTGFGDRD